MLIILITFYLIFIQSIFCEQCFIPGKCENNGGHYLTKIVFSVEDCIVLCDSGNICEWSTFDPRNGYCELFQKICNKVDYTLCPLCINNERNCITGK